MMQLTAPIDPANQMNTRMRRSSSARIACFGVVTWTVVAEECCVEKVGVFSVLGWLPDGASLTLDGVLVAGCATTVSCSDDEGLGVGMARVATVSSSPGKGAGSSSLSARDAPVSDLGSCSLISTTKRPLPAHYTSKIRRHCAPKPSELQALATTSAVAVLPPPNFFVTRLWVTVGSD